MTGKGPPAPEDAVVIAITATYRRPAELGRLIASLEGSGAAVRALVVVDNAGDAQTRALCEGSRMPIVYHHPGANLGCGGGLAEGERLAFEKYGEELTHLWILDDDAVAGPEALGSLLEAMSSEQADAAHPLVTAESGSLGWHPGLLDPEKFQAVKRPQSPEEFVARCGDAPALFSWAQGIALLVSRRAIEELGFHRSDYWVRGEDLEFSLRITHQYKGIYVPAARVAHLPPPDASGAGRELEFAKHLALLQNVAYTGLRLRHGRRIARTIPGNVRHFLEVNGWGVRALGGVVAALCRGAVLGFPPGANREGRERASDGQRDRAQARWLSMDESKTKQPGSLRNPAVGVCGGYLPRVGWAKLSSCASAA